MTDGGWWRHCWLAFTKSGPYDPSGRDQEIARLRAEHDDWTKKWHVMASGHPRETDEEKASEFAAGLIHVHHHVYGTWPPATKVQRALDALDIPNRGPLQESP